jgi:two-component system NtrC family response regulator
MQQLFAKVRRVAPSDLSILLEGESGTGKELVARAIHQESSRRDGPFIAINCGAIPETLLESELFGHEKGSFTGAHVQRKGRIELADKGTLFLDEIGELSLGLQVKLLRFLQEHVVDRIGGRHSIVVNTRVIAATNVDLVKALSRGTFRKDLFYRLNVVHLSMPPLRDRDQDATMLAQEFVLKYRALLNPRVVGLSQAARDVIQAYPWSGNVRELQNRIRRALVVAQGATLQPLDLGISTELSDESRLTLRAAREEFDKTLVRQTLARTNGNVARTAEALGLSRQAVYNLVERLGLSDRLALSRT